MEAEVVARPDAHHELVGASIPIILLAGSGLKRGRGGRSRDSALVHPRRPPLSSREEEGDAAPAVRIDREDQRGEGGAARARRHRAVLEVAGLVAVACELAEEDRVAVELERLHLREQRDLGRLDRRARHRRRRVHREEHERLEQVVLDDVADDAEAVEVPAAAAGAETSLNVSCTLSMYCRVPRRLEAWFAQRSDAMLRITSLPR